MGLINIYNTLNNTHTKIEGNGYIKNLLPGYNLANCQIIKAGELVGSDYEVKNDDILYLRVTPRAVSAIAAGIVFGGLALAGIVTVAEIGAAKQEKRIQESMEKAQRDAANLAQQINTRPFIKGAKNKSALGSLIQYQLGRVYNTPYTLTDGAINISGQYGVNQYYNLNLCLGYGDLQVEKVLIGDEVILENNSGIASGIHQFKSDSPYYDAGNFLELRQAGEDFTNDQFNKKIILTNDGSELKHEFEANIDIEVENNNGEPVIKQVAENTKKLEVCIQFNGLRIYDNDLSTWVERKATVRPYWSNDGGASWHEFYFSGMTNNTIKINSKDTIRFIATKEFTPSEVMSVNAAGEIEYKNIMLKVVKTTPKAEMNSNEDCYLAYYQSYCYDPKKSSINNLVECLAVEDFFKNKLTRLALRVNKLLDDIHVIASAKAPTWNGSNWSETKTATSNPAAEIYEILTSDKHNPSKLDITDFNREELGELYEYCENEGYSCNTIITNPIKKLELIGNILKTCNATLYKKNGVYGFAIDKKEDLPVALLNAENIKNINYTKEFKRKPNGIKVTYTNGKSWAIDTFYIVIDPVKKAIRDYRTEEDILTELALEYITDYKHAYKIALRTLKEINLQPRVITAGVGKVGEDYPLYSTVLVQYKEFRQGLKSSVIEDILYNAGGDVIGIRVQDLLSFNTLSKYGVVIQAVTPEASALIYRAVEFDYNDTYLKTSKGRLLTSKGLLKLRAPITNTKDLYFNEPITNYKPQLYNTVSIGLLDNNGEFTKITNKMKIVNLEPDGDAGYNLTLKDYNEAIYTPGEIPQYKSNITEPVKKGNTIPVNTNINSTAVADAKAVIYQETGLNKLSDKDITETNEETGKVTIKADLIDADAIKAKTGFFDDITVTGRIDGDYILTLLYADSKQELVTKLKKVFTLQYYYSKYVLCSGHLFIQTKYNKLHIDIKDIVKTGYSYMIDGYIRGANDEGDTTIDANYSGTFPAQTELFKTAVNIDIDTSLTTKQGLLNIFSIEYGSRIYWINNINILRADLLY